MPRHGILRTTSTTMMTLEQPRNYVACDDRAKGAVTIDSSASAALLRQRATCRTTWKSRSGRSKRTRCSSPASRLGAATDAEIAVAPNPASTAARTASLDGSSSAIRNAPGDTPKPCNAASNVDRVPDPGSRRTQSVRSAYPAQVGRSLTKRAQYRRRSPTGRVRPAPSLASDLRSCPR